MWSRTNYCPQLRLVVVSQLFQELNKRPSREASPPVRVQGLADYYSNTNARSTLIYGDFEITFDVRAVSGSLLPTATMVFWGAYLPRSEVPARFEFEMNSF